jgi:hypothetical protein
MSADPPVRPDEVAEVLDFGPPPPAQSGRSEPDVGRAGTVAYAPGAALVAAPTAQGGYCLVPVPERSKPSFVCLEGNGARRGTFDFMYWIDTGGDGLAWYLFGRVEEEGADRIELFEQVTHPFDEEGSEALPGTPLAVDVGPGGFFLARVPRELWPGLDLAYGELTVLDRDGTALGRRCLFLGAAPDSALTNAGIGGHGDPLASDAGGEAVPGVGVRAPAAYPCPPTGSAAEAVRLTPVRPRAEDLTAVTGHDVTSGERIELSSFMGRPLLLAVWDPHSPTAARLLKELDAFARRHPEAQILGVLDPHAEAAGRRAVKDLALSFPTMVVDPREDFARPLIWDAHGHFGPHVLVLDGRGRIAVELASASDNHLAFYAVVTQEALEDALASATH